MISSLDPNTRLFLISLNRVGDRMDEAQRQISTGLRVSSVADDPTHVATLLWARQHLETAKQVEVNLGRVKAEADSAESSLQTASTLLDRVRTLGAQGSNPTQTADSRVVLANEIGGVLEQLVGLSRTAVEGRYVFSGDSDQTVPYTIDLALPTPVSAYQGTAATRRVQHPNGSTFAVGQEAQDIFDNPDPLKNVFQSVEALRRALLANDDDAIRVAEAALSPVAAHLQTELSFYGVAQNRISEALEFGEQLQLQLKSRIGNIEDADMTEAILELQQGATQQQAALSSWASRPRSTLFDFLG